MATEEIQPKLEGDDHIDGADENKEHASIDKEKREVSTNGSADLHADTEHDTDDDSDMPELIDSHPDPVKSTESSVLTESRDTDRNGDAPDANDEPPEWMDIIGNGQLMKKILQEGRGPATRPQRGNQVTIRSKGSLEDGSEVDIHQEITFILGEGDVVSAWELCLPLMDLCEISLVKASPRFAYGESGRMPDVPPNVQIMYELELLDVQEAPDPENMAVDEVCTMGDKKRERGNELYARKDYPGAINSYTKALKLLEKVKISKDDSTKQTVSGLQVKCYNNLAAAQLKIEAYEPALKSCLNALAIEPENVKALFRKGKVLASQGDYEQAVRTMKDALTREPSNKVIHQELSRLTSRESQERESERQLYQRMVGNMADITKVNNKTSIKKWLIAALSIGVVILAAVATIFAQRSESVS